MAAVFLEAQWKKLAIANYAVDPGILEPFLPNNTELDHWNNTCYVSLVGFMFLDTRVMGFRIPFHINFEEVNLRFYVCRRDGRDWKRGVVFIREIVSKPALTFVANSLYRENYRTMPMRHSWTYQAESQRIEYQWRKHRWNSFSVTARDTAMPILEGSEEEFITEHYWGYTRIDSRHSSEYGVEHPRWNVYPVIDYSIDVDFGLVYGNKFGFLQQTVPKSVFLAEGSVIKVMHGQRF